MNLNKKISLIHVMVSVMAALLFPASVKAQEDYRFDIGAGFGISGYLGDANTANLWQNPGWDGEIFLRYIANPRWGFKTNFYVGGLSGDSSQMTNVFPSGETYKFTNTFYELGEMAEFHFFPYGMGESYRKLKRFTPYITGGLSVTMWSVGGKTSAGFTLPFGIGAKFKLSKRWNLGLEFLMKKVFTDNFDGSQLDDPLAIKSSFMKNTDWYSTLTLTISYEFSKRCEVCNYKD